MNTRPVQIKRALISVSNKNGVLELAQGLHALGVQIISTGGTAKTIAAAGVPVIEIEQYTGFPEIMEGRVKTMHPKVAGGILGLRDTHAEAARAHSILWIDLVVCNLYPFANTIKKPGVAFDEVVENIDIGGPTMIRAAAKNMGWVTVMVDPSEYANVLAELKQGEISFATRERLAVKAFGHTAEYDGFIHQYFNQCHSPNIFPSALTLKYTKYFNLRYGENPHQSAAVYKEPGYEGSSVLTAKILQGKELSYNNINDADGALSCLKEFAEPACVVVKHANPCGVAAGQDITEVFHRAYNADTLAAFGGIIALNQTCTKEIAKELNKVFVEIILAPAFEPEALNILAKKPKVRVLELLLIEPHPNPLLRGEGRNDFRFVEGGLLAQDKDTKTITEADLQFVTNKKPTPEEIHDMLFGWKILKHVKSNAIVIVKDNTTLGIGPGQVSRVDSVEIALRKSGDKIKGAVLCSDAFFPFRDSIDKIAPTGITAIIQPGGSLKDQAVIDACNEHGLTMVFTGVRCFKH